MQFQQPAFLIAMAALLAIFACNLAGFFEIPLPSWLGDVAAGTERSGLIGDFRRRRHRDPARDTVLGTVPRHRGRLPRWPATQWTS